MLKKLFVMAAVLMLACASYGEKLSKGEYYNKVLGCWNGKCIGGALGMPREGAFWANQVKEFPELKGYLVGAKGGWSDYLGHQQVPADGEWHKIVFNIPHRTYYTDTIRFCPIIGISPEAYSRPVRMRIKNIRNTSHGIAFADTDFEAFGAAVWNGEYFEINSRGGGERSWIRLKDYSVMDVLSDGRPFELEMDAMWISGENRVGIAYDFYTNGVNGFGPDDDTSYQIIGLRTLEEYGPGLTAENIGEMWTRYLFLNPNGTLAEEIALARLKKGIMPPESGNHEVGEAIGGQMKGEIWGLVCPGDPELAAEYAYKDGIVAHRENGVYGEMFVAAMIAAAFYESDIDTLLRKGLSVIPENCKYAQMVKHVIKEHKAGIPWYKILAPVKKEYPNLCDPVYPECAIITLALLEGRGDFEAAIRTAFYCGSDTDCNCGTVGALMGLIYGFDKIPAKWKEPINNDFRCFVKGSENWKITELAKSICRQGEIVMKYARRNKQKP